MSAGLVCAQLWSFATLATFAPPRRFLFFFLVLFLVLFLFRAGTFMLCSCSSAGHSGGGSGIAAVRLPWFDYTMICHAFAPLERSRWLVCCRLEAESGVVFLTSPPDSEAG